MKVIKLMMMIMNKKFNLKIEYNIFNNNKLF